MRCSWKLPPNTVRKADSTAIWTSTPAAPLGDDRAFLDYAWIPSWR
jgi:hypothetical protein